MHFCVINSKTIKLTIAIILVAVLLSITINGATSAEVYFNHNTRKVPIYCVETEKKQVAISFDAAWGADKTQQIIDTLKEYNCNGTFFLVGFWIDKYPQMVKAISDAGIEIGSHSNTHPDLTTASAEKLQEEIATPSEMLTQITGKPVELFRCPYGAYNNAVIDSIIANKMLPIQWDVDSLDWKGISAQEITTRVLDKVKNGSIILCHNNSDHIIDALVMLLDRLIMQGYEVVNVGQLVLHENYTIDRNGVQHANVV